MTFKNVATAPRIGLRANWRQFTLLVVVNIFVGAMVGLERSVLPLLAEQDFGIASRTAILSFLISFGLVKAGTNYFAGRFSDRIGRKPVLILGWLAALPVPVMIILAPSWGWVIAANVLLGINQGLAWSTTIIMKIDLVGPARRGLAMGLNEAAGYVAVSLAAAYPGVWGLGQLATGWVGDRLGRKWMIVSGMLLQAYCSPRPRGPSLPGSLARFSWASVRPSPTRRCLPP